MHNHVTLLGRLAQEPELKHTTNGTPVTSFDLAVSVPSKEKDAPPYYIPIVCWKETAKFVNLYLGKGRQVLVEGRITVRKYTDQDGKNRKAVEVTASRVYFADSNKAAENGGQQPAYTPTSSDYEEVAEDEDLPF